jgi:hypothetical protein
MLMLMLLENMKKWKKKYMNRRRHYSVLFMFLPNNTTNFSCGTSYLLFCVVGLSLLYWKLYMFLLYVLFKNITLKTET